MAKKVGNAKSTLKAAVAGAAIGAAAVILSDKEKRKKLKKEADKATKKAKEMINKGNRELEKVKTKTDKEIENKKQRLAKKVEKAARDAQT